MHTDEAWKQSWAEGSVGQLFEVSEINGNIISFTTPLHFDIRNDLNPIIRPQNFRKSCGIENLYIEKTNANNHTFEFKNAAYNWLRQVESFNTRRSHVNVNTGLANEFRENYIHHSHYYGGGGSGYGIELNFHASDNLIEDNIFTHLRHAMMVHVGAVGNEFNYNFSNDPVQGENGDEGPLNDVWSPPDISLHGHWAQYNLFEGNVVKEIGIGDHWGPMGPGNTFLRNVVSGEGIYEKDANLNQNIIGNWSSSYSSDLTSINTIYHLNVIDGTQQKSSEISEDQAPSSYSYLSKPWFWSAELSWPVSPVSLTDSLVIPASIRFANGDFFKIDTNNIVSNSVQITQKQLPNFSITNIDNYTYFEVDQNSEIQFIQIFNTNGKKVTQVHCSKKSICRVDLKEHRGIKIIRLKIDDTLQHHLTK
jgi:hypothetical protein